jgi:hypothetical protein
VGREEFGDVVIEEGEPGSAEALGIVGQIESGETGFFCGCCRGAMEGLEFYVRSQKFSVLM